LAATLLLTGGGTPFLYYGDERGLTGQKPDERIRSPLPWGGTAPAAGFSATTRWEPLEEGWQTRNVAAQTADPASLRSTYRDLIRIRAAHPAVAGGATLPLTPSDPAVHAILRATADEAVAIVANVSDHPISGATLSLDKGPLCEGVGRASALFRSDRAAQAEIAPPVANGAGGFAGWAPLASLPPRSAVVIGLGS
jgi:glycosidase